MHDYQRQFIDFMVACEVLTFGDFTTKSGRQTPYFINTGRYRTGAQMKRLAGFYADAIEDSGIAFDVLFGPAYKGIPLVVATSIALSERGHDVAYCFNRKEAKDHGEGGHLVGHAPQAGDRVLILEDVTTAGTSIRETVPILRGAAAVELAGLGVSVDRKERGVSDKSALCEVGEQFAMPTFAIVDVDQIIEHLRDRRFDGRLVLDDECHARMLSYRENYGC
jgi:orotate phosphoribosyltransferase